MVRGREGLCTGGNIGRMEERRGRDQIVLLFLFLSLSISISISRNRLWRCERDLFAFLFLYDIGSFRMTAPDSRFAASHDRLAITFTYLVHSESSSAIGFWHSTTTRPCLNVNCGCFATDLLWCCVRLAISRSFLCGALNLNLCMCVSMYVCVGVFLPPSQWCVLLTISWRSCVRQATCATRSFCKWTSCVSGIDSSVTWFLRWTGDSRDGAFSAWWRLHSRR